MENEQETLLVWEAGCRLEELSCLGTPATVPGDPQLSLGSARKGFLGNPANGADTNTEM